MRTIRHILTIGFFLLISNPTFSSSIFYPYTLKLDNGIKIKSIAYRIYDTPEPGMTWIYKKNHLLYSIDKRLTGYLITDESGDILVEINFRLYDKMYGLSEINEQGDTIYLGRLEGDAINIYKSGIKVKTFDFKDFGIDPDKVSINYGRFYWGTQDKEIKAPAIIQNDTLRIITIDSSEIIVSLKDFILDKQKLTQKEKQYFSNLKTKRKLNVRKRGLPKMFLLPLFDSKVTIESGLANYLDYLPADNERDSAKLQIYIHTLLIDKTGRCVLCYVTATLRESTSIDFGYEPDKDLEKKIEDWLMKQSYQTKLIPRWTDKYGFTDFIYLKE